MSEAAADQAPHPHEFVAQLIRQLLDDLDDILFDGEAVAGAAFDLLGREAANGAARGAVLLLLTDAALAAHRTLLHGLDPATAADEGEAGAALVALLPGIGTQLPALRAHAERLARMLALAEPASSPIHERLARIIVRFYSGLGSGDDSASGSALLELRSVTVHLDAIAAAIEAPTFAPRRVLRPDRFHDWFMRYTSLAQGTELPAGERAVATLSRDGRISAVITEDRHPLEAAAQAVRELIPGDEQARDDAMARIRALLDFIDSQRGRPVSPLGDVLGDAEIHLSLVVAAATAPLAHAGHFQLGSIGQIARHNQSLLRGQNRSRAATTH